MLYRAIIAAETVGSTGLSTLSIAQIVGISERNNRRDDITSGLMFLDGWCLMGMEGHRADVDRLLRRLTDLDLDALPATGLVAHVRTTVFRDGDTFRLFFPQEYAEHVAEVVLDALVGLQ